MIINNKITVAGKVVYKRCTIDSPLRLIVEVELSRFNTTLFVCYTNENTMSLNNSKTLLGTYVKVSGELIDIDKEISRINAVEIVDLRFDYVDTDSPSRSPLGYGGFV